ncbi:MAG: calcium/proton exchanger, partial [Terriglobales bacterium]
ALLLGGVAAVGLAILQRGPLWIFVLAAVGLVPLAAVLGEATRVLALSLGPVAAGVLEGTLGNASELILALVALRAGLVEVVKASLTGSIISNLLLVMGLALLCGGWRRKKQFLNRDLARSNATTLFLAAVGLVVPAVFSLSVYGELGPNRPVLENLSLWTAAILTLIYLISLAFQLRTAIPVPAAPATAALPASRRGAVISMLAALVAVAVLSGLVVGQLKAAQSAFHGSDIFWGAVVFALIGNAAEHGVAIGAARRDEMDLAMAIGVGSSLQIALLLAPLLVFVSLALGHPMSLVFSGIEVVAVVLSTLMVGMVSGDGETTWLEGAQLLAVYAILAACFYFVPV